MTATVLDAVIVGQGLAGTTLAWHLLERGWRIAIVDDGANVSASKVSAGLLTPIMGKNFTRNDDGAVVEAEAFYRRIATRTGARLFEEITAVRLFTGEAERIRFERRREALTPYLMVPQPIPLLPADMVDVRHGGFAMRSSQLDVAAYLEASRAHLPIVVGRIDATADLARAGGHLVAGGHATRRIMFCDGFAGAGNPYFPQLHWRNAKGNILLVRLAKPLPRVSIHRSLWLAPTGHLDIFRVGATFDWDTFDHVPTAEGRVVIEAELQAYLTCPYEVVDHLAAVRPIISGGPRIGASRIDQRVLMLNGLGTKGATRAPKLARLLAAHICDGAAIPPDVDVNADGPKPR